MKITLTAWRQASPRTQGEFETYEVPGVSPDMSFLEMLDTVNERLIHDGREPIAFEHDCREGICGSCGFVVNGVPHGPERVRPHHRVGGLHRGGHRRCARRQRDPDPEAGG